MPEAFKSFEKLCSICGNHLILKANRDIKRKRFCSRRCLAVWLRKTGRFGNTPISEEAKQRMRESKLKLLKTGWKPVGWRKYNLPKNNTSYKTSGNEREHRKIMNSYYGVKLPSNIHVHHLDGNKKNNEIGNLIILSNIEHTKLHMQLRKDMINECRV
jgi:hypothetical protein